MKNFFDGIFSYIQAFGLMFRLRLWGLALLPGLLSLFLGSWIIWIGWNYSDNLSAWLMQIIHFKWFGQNWLQQGVAGMFTIFGIVLTIFLGFITYRNIMLVIGAPFMSIISARVHSHLVGRKVEDPPFLGSILRGLRVAIRNILKEMFYTIFLLLLSLFPLFAPFTSALIFLVQANYAGFGNLDFTLERFYNTRQSVQFVSQNRGLALGNGSVFLLLLLVPVVGLLFAPAVATVAGTIDTVNRLQNVPMIGEANGKTNANDGYFV